MRSLVLVLALSAAAARPAGAQSAPVLSQPIGSEPIGLQPGDSVRITVWRKPELSGQFAVTGDGALAHPLYRSLMVVGQSIASLEDRLRTFLSTYEERPQFVVEPLLRVAIAGEVGRPNLYALSPQTTIAQAIAIAGGPTTDGRYDRVRLTRGSRTITLDLTHPDAGVARMAIRSGDEIIVERRRAIFREYIAPTFTVVGGTAALISAIVRARR